MPCAIQEVMLNDLNQVHQTPEGYMSGTRPDLRLDQG